MISILYALIYLCEGYIFFYYTNHIFTRRKKGLLVSASCIICGYLMNYLVSFQNNTLLNVILFLTVNALLIYLLYQTGPVSAIFHSLLLCILMGGSELIILNTILKLAFDFQPDQIDPYHLVMLTILSKLFYFLLTYLVVQLFPGDRKYSGDRKQRALILIVIPLFSFFLIITFMFISQTTRLTGSLNYLVSCCCLLLLIMNLFIFWYYENNLKRDINFANLQLQIQYEKDMAAYNKRVIEQYENHRIIIHDIKKHLISISLLNQKQDYEAIDRYLSNLLQSADLQENLQVSDQPFLNSLLLRYKQECTKQKISFFTDIRSGVISFLNESDLTSLLCNLLDNAMEAACDMPGAFIELRIEKRENTNITLIVLVNSSRINPLLPDNSLLRSHKEPSLFHGLGMKSVRRVLDKYHGDITYHYDTSNNTFHTVLCVMEND